MGEPGKGRGPVERRIVRVVTPGTVTDDGLLEERRSTLVAAVCNRGEREVVDRLLTGGELDF